MPKRYTITSEGQRYIVLPYNKFAMLGMHTDPLIPQVAVPLFDRIENCLVQPLVLWRDYQAKLMRSGLDRVGAVIMQRDTNRSGALDDVDTGLYVANITNPTLMFRGDSREERGLIPSLLRRMNASTLGVKNRLVRKRLHHEFQVAERVRAAFQTIDPTPMTTFEARAAARHYGAMSALLDFSFDPWVAAYFAHPPFSDFEREQTGATPIGILYCLTFAALQSCFPVQGWGLDSATSIKIQFYPAGGAEIPYLSADLQTGEVRPAMLRIALPGHLSLGGMVIRGTIAPRVKRIRAQRGFFFEIGHEEFSDWREIGQLWYLLDFACQKWCFVRRDAQFEEADAGATTQSLLPPDELPASVLSELRSHHV